MGLGMAHVVRALVSEAATERTRLWVVTCGAQNVSGGYVNPAQAVLWGLGRVVGLEHPGLWGGLVDLDPSVGVEEQVDALLDEITQSDGEDQVAYREGTRHVARLVRRAPPPVFAVRWRPDGRYLITGGFGGIGLALARWLVEGGARHIVLIGRRGLTEERQASVVGEVEALGASVEVVAADVADEHAMRALFERLTAEGPPVRGIFHLAADIQSAHLNTLSREALERMLRAKLGGTWALHRLSRGLDLDVFVLFSSTTSLLGVAGLGHYAAANQFMDALAHYRRALDLPALAVNWGTWELMRTASEADQQQFLQAGLIPMPTHQALDALAGLVAADTSQAAVAAVDWQALRAVYESRRGRPFLEKLGVASRIDVRAPASREQSDLRRRFEEAPESQRRDVVLAHVRGEVARILRLDGSQPIDSDRGLFDMGMDSLMSVELKSRLEATAGARLPSTLTFNYPNIGALTDYLVREVLDPAAAVGEHPAGTTVALRDDLSEDELAALLAAKLSTLR